MTEEKGDDEYCPTMQFQSSQAEEEEKATTTDKLQQKFINLQKEWDSFKQSNPKTLRRRSPNSNILLGSLSLLDNSPRNLMSSLQKKQSSSELGSWKVVRTSDSAVEEVIRERREAIESGRLKGRRRLFEVAIGETEMGLVQDCEVRSVLSFDDSDDDDEDDECFVGSKNISDCFQGCSYSGVSSPSSCCLSAGKVERIRKETEEREKVEAPFPNNSGRDNWRRRRDIAIMGWFGVVFLIFAICIIRSFGHDDDDDAGLVPT